VGNYPGVRLLAAWAGEHAPEVTAVRDVEPTHIRSWFYHYGSQHFDFAGCRPAAGLLRC
jgi:hypothetical protein